MLKWFPEEVPDGAIRPVRPTFRVRGTRGGSGDRCTHGDSLLKPPPTFAETAGLTRA